MSGLLHEEMSEALRAITVTRKASETSAQLRALRAANYTVVDGVGELQTLKALGSPVIKTSVDGVFWSYENRAVFGHVYWTPERNSRFARDLRVAARHDERLPRFSNDLVLRARADVANFLKARGKSAEDAWIPVEVALAVGLDYSSILAILVEAFE